MAAKVTFEYVVLRYVHDPITQEFINIGVVVYSAENGFVAATINRGYGRISSAFVSISRAQYQRLVTGINHNIAQLGKTILQSDGLFEQAAPSLSNLLPAIWPIDDSSITFSEIGVGFAQDLDAKLTALYNRLILKYAEKGQTLSRNDAEIWKVFKTPLLQRNIVEKLNPRELKPYANTQPYKFNYVWKNGVYRPFEPVSLDLIHGESIRNKVDGWITRANKFAINESVGEITLLLGKPHNESLQRDYDYALSDFDKLANNLRVVEERDADSFSETLAAEINDYESKLA